MCFVKSMWATGADVQGDIFINENCFFVGFSFSYLKLRKVELTHWIRWCYTILSADRIKHRGGRLGS